MLDKSSHCIALPFNSCPFSYLLLYLKSNLFTPFETALVVVSSQLAALWLCAVDINHHLFGSSIWRGVGLIKEDLKCLEYSKVL